MTNVYVIREYFVTYQIAILFTSNSNHKIVEIVFLQA